MNKAGGKGIKTSLIFLILWFFILKSFHVEAKGVTVSEIEIQGLHSISREEFLYLLNIHKGRTIDEESVRLSIKRAFLKGFFEDIAVKASEDEESEVIITVKERDIVNDIFIEGDYPFSEKTVKKLYLLKEDDIIRCDIIEKAEKRLKQDLEIRGFPHASIHSRIKRLKEPNRVDLYLSVDTGKPLTIKKINIFGDEDSEIKAVVRLSEGDVFDRTVLEKDIERIKGYYKKQGHFKPVIGPYSFVDGVLNISVNPGKRLQISIEGNNSFSTKTLMKEMPFFTAEDFGDDIVEEAVHRILSVYHTEGYPFAQVAPVISSKDNLILLNFFIFEGPEIQVGNISFTGNTLKEENLKEIMELKEGKEYNPDLIDEDREKLEEVYLALGYLSARIEEFQTIYDEDSQKMDILVSVHEGTKTIIGNVIITGAEQISEEKIRNTIYLKQGDTYNEVDIADARFRILDLYSKSGFPEATVTVNRSFEDHKASVIFDIHEGPETHFGKVIITGNRKTRYEVIKRELQHEEGMLFDYGILTKERQKLYKLGLFSDIDIEVLDRYDHKKDILMKIREGKAGSVELSLGYAEYELYRSILDLSYRNLWGMNRQASMRFELSSLERRLVVQYYEPWFLGRPIPFRTFLLNEEKKEINIDTRETRYRLLRNSATAGIEKKLSESLKSEIYYEFSVVKTFDVKPDVILSREDTGTLLISGLRLGIIYDTRDHPFYPKKGLLSGISTKLTAPVFLSETDFIKLVFYCNAYREIFRGIVLAASFRGGVAQGFFDTQELPIVERFFLGGRTTVRGYDQDTLGPKGSDGTPTGGNAFLMENLEIRMSIGRGIGLVAFLDGGNVWLDIKDIDPSDFKFTTGIGLRYNTPVGPIRIDYGHKLQREKDESAGEVHFSIGHAF